MRLNEDPPVSGRSKGHFTSLAAKGWVVVGGGGSGVGNEGSSENDEEKTVEKEKDTKIKTNQKTQVDSEDEKDVGEGKKFLQNSVNGGKGEEQKHNRIDEDSSSGFVGCVKLLSIDGAVYDFRLAPRGDAVGGSGIHADCRHADGCRGEDGGQRCANGATCITPEEEEEMGEEEEKGEDTGEGEEKKTSKAQEKRKPSRKQSQRTRQRRTEPARPRTGSARTRRSACICPLGFQGTECRERTELSVPAFDGRRSYVKMQGWLVATVLGLLHVFYFISTPFFFSSASGCLS